METIREWAGTRRPRGFVCVLTGPALPDVPIGGSRGALRVLEEKLGIDLTSGCEPDEFTPSKL